MFYLRNYRNNSRVSLKKIDGKKHLKAVINGSGVEIGNTLQYSCLENCMDRGAWWATVHGVAKSRTQLNNQAHNNI